MRKLTSFILMLAIIAIAIGCEASQEPFRARITELVVIDGQVKQAIVTKQEEITRLTQLRIENSGRIKELQKLLKEATKPAPKEEIAIPEVEEKTLMVTEGVVEEKKEE